MKGWEPQLPASFPLERIHEGAVREGVHRRSRRRTRYQVAASGVCALVVVATAMLVGDGEERRDQVQAGPGPTSSIGAPEQPGPDASHDFRPSIRAAANGKIAFIRSTGPNDPAPKIYLMNEDGTGQTMIAETTQGGELSWSPDGTSLAFRDVGGIWIVNADGTGERRLPTAVNSAQSPAWSPDGTKIAFRGLDGLEGGVYVADLDGTTRRLTDDSMDGSPAWSPDGGHIAYASGDDIHIMEADGSSPRRLTSLEGFEDEPTWSPDGRQIAFRHNSTISVIEVDKGANRQLATPGGTAVVNPEGRGANKLASGRGDPADPHWSPDGKKIVFGLYQSGEACSIWVMNADGSQQSQLTDNRSCDRHPAWQPRLP